MVYHEFTYKESKTIYIITENGNALAKAVLNNDTPDVIHIIDVSIIESFRRKGLGTMLVHECEALGKKHSKTSSVVIISTDDTLSINWFKKLGYNITDDDGDTYVMEKQL